MTRPPFFIYQTFLPSRQRDCFTPTSLSIPTTLSKPHPPPCLTPPFQNRTIPSPFAMLTSVCADTLSHPHHHSPHTNILASLVKGEVLSPEKIRATTGGIAYTHQTSPSSQPSQKGNNPSLRTMSLPLYECSACFAFALSHLLFVGRMFVCAYTVSHPHHPSPHTNILASLVKGEVLSPEKIRATTGGIAAPTLSIPSTLSKPHPSLAPHHHTWLPCQRELDCDKAISYYKLQHSAISSTLISSLPYLSQD